MISVFATCLFNDLANVPDVAVDRSMVDHCLTDGASSHLRSDGLFAETCYGEFSVPIDFVG